MTVEYTPVPTGASGEVPHGCCVTYVQPRCSRRNVIALFVILVISAIFVLTACYGSTLLDKSKFCMDKNTIKVVPNQITPGGRRKPHHYPHTQRHLPDCIIIGVRKAGTRALLNYLNMHPDIATAPQEIHFFDDKNNYSKGLSWYRRQMPFAFNEQITIEKTPNYFVSDDVPGRIYHLNSSMKLILIVRDPLYRAVSDYAQIRERRIQQGMVMEDFEDLVFRGDEETQEEEVDNVDTHYKAINRSIYFYHMQKWLNFFSLDQIHIVDGDNMVLNPMEEVRKVESFLQVEHKISKDQFYFDRKKGFYCIRPDFKRPKCLNKTKGRQHPKIDRDVRDILNEFFEPWNKRFFKLVGRTFRWPKDLRHINEKQRKKRRSKMHHGIF